MKRSCGQIEPLIDDLVSEAVEADGMQEHLAACASCRATLVARYREERALRELAAAAGAERLAGRIQAALAGKAPLPPPAEGETVASHQTLSLRSAIRGSRARRPLVRWLAAVAVLLSLAVGASWWLATRPAGVAHIDSVRGTVQVRTAAGTVAAQAGTDLIAGQMLETGADGAAVLTFPDRTQLEFGAETVLKKLAAESAVAGKEVVLERGLVIANVRPQPAGRPMIYGTPHGTATVRGTRLSLAVAPEASQLEVREGSVQLARGERSTAVPAGYYAVAGEGLELAPRRLTPVLAGLPPGAVVLFYEDFSADAPPTWQGARRLQPGSPSDWAVVAGPLTSREFRKTLFGELRSPRQQTGWRVGQHTHLRLRYLAEAFTPKQGLWITLKRADGSNYGLHVKSLVPNRWQTLTLRLSDFPLVLKPAQRLAAGETLHEFALFPSTGGATPPAAARFWISDLVLFELPQPLPAAELADVQTDS
jgi:hypothetical protein